jgi:hypothetical protein
MSYQKADTAWFAACHFGIAVHWTAHSKPVTGPALPFAAAVAAFDAERFVSQVADSGASYLLFTVTHALQQVPAPCAAVDRLLPGRTTERDLVGELADGCQRRGLKLFLYYNHSCNGGDDRQWEQACGYHGPDKQAFADHVCEIVRELSERYGPRVAGWWFDSCFSVDPSGPNNSLTTDMGGFRFPWESLTAAAKAGNQGSLVAYNPACQPSVWNFMYTTHQDYLAGEANELIEPPSSRWAANGLQNHRWVCLDNPDWVHAKVDTPLFASRYDYEQLLAYLQCAAAASTPVTFNTDVDQAGRLNPASLSLLRRLSDQLRAGR